VEEKFNPVCGVTHSEQQARHGFSVVGKSTPQQIQRRVAMV
jgi:hypothetical protein